MPILPREPDLHPVTLLDEPADVAPWWAVYTMARREKELMRRLRQLDVPFYCPLVKRRRRSPQGRWLQSWTPLFAGYVFMRGDDEARHRALTTNCVSKALPVDDRAQLVHDLVQIQRLISADVPMTPEARLAPGATVRIRSGPMAGVEGQVIQRRGKELLVVAVKFLQQGASVILQDFQLEAT